MEKCPNCSAMLYGKYCHACGQKVPEPGDRTILHFIYQFFGSAFFLENNFLKNLWILIRKPGQIPLDFIEGRRKRWMPPFSLFLLINLFYFLYTPLTDLNLRLNEQLNQFHHSNLARHLVNHRLNRRGVTLETYSLEYNKKSTSYANSLIILHLPVFAGFLALIFIRKKYFFSDHFIFGLYFLAFVLLMALIQSAFIYLLIGSFGRAIFEATGSALLIFILLYLFLSLRKTYSLNNGMALISTLPVFIAFIISHFLYRTILFLIVFCVT